MKKLSTATMMAVIAALLVATVVFAMFTNGNFESGDFTGWTKDTTNQNGGILVGPPPSYVPHPASSVDDMFIVDAAWMNTNFGAGNTCDPNSNGSICLPYAGNNSAVVNYLGNGGNLNKLSQAGLVASGDVGADGMYHIFFAYAPVLDKGAHSPADQPFMYVKLTRVRSGSPDQVLFDKFSYPDDGNPNWQWNTSITSIAYMNWQVYDLTYAPADLGPGDTLTLDVIAAGCVYTQAAHWGYVYVDEFGSVSPSGSTAPSISSLSPSSGPDSGGTSVTIVGSHFTGATAVSIGASTLLAGSFTVVDDTHITFTTPSNAAGLVDVSVTNPGGSAVYPYSFTYLAIPAPTITNLAPNSGPTDGGTTVVITGTDLTGGTVTFDGLPATCTVDSATQITCTSPAHAAGPVDVAVTTVGGTATSTGGFTYIPAPVAVDDAYATKMSRAFTGATVLVNDTHTNPLTAVKVTNPAHASAFTFNPNGTFTYEPANGFQGTDTFTYKANDGTTDSNVATVSIVITPIIKTIYSNVTYDGWVMETNEFSNKGGMLFAGGQLRLGDTGSNQQYRTFTSFNTVLPHAAAILNATMQIKPFDIAGVNPFTTHGKLLVDIKTGFFGKQALESSDFQAAASKSNIGSFRPILAKPGWYMFTVKALDYTYINRTGATQFRLRFTLQDNNNNITDWARFQPGKNVKFVIQYYIPHP